MPAAPTANLVSAFAFVAVKPGGRRRYGLRQARSVSALAEALRSENQLLVKYWTLPAWAASPGKMQLKDHAALNEQLGLLLSRGVPLVEALEVTASIVKGPAKNRVVRMKEMVAAGSSLADACRAVGGFDEVAVSVYRAAERTGDLAGAAKQLGMTARRRLMVGNKAVTLMVYPAIVLTISVVVATLMMMFVVPQLGEALAQNDLELPLYSKIVIGVGTWMRENATLLAVALAGALTLVVVGHKQMAVLAGTFMRRFPMIRDVVLAQEAAQFFSVMAAMTRTGVPIGDALGVANNAIAHPVMRSQLERLRKRLIEGGLLRVLIDEVAALPLATRRLLIAAERSGDLESAFTTLASDMTDEVERKSTRLLAALEPALIVVMFLIIGSLLMAILLPMLTLPGRIKM